jgi:dipeptidyl-peptidase-4
MRTRTSHLAFGGALCLGLAGSSYEAEKQPITLQSLEQAGRGGLGGFAPGRVWHPRGGSFIYIDHNKVMQWSRATMEAKEIFSLEAADRSAIEPERDRAFGWENRRVSAHRLQYSSDGSKILVEVKGDLFVWDAATSKLEQLTATDISEADPKFAPDATRISFRRGHDLYVLEIATKKVTRLTRDGDATHLNAMLDWVYPEELDLGTAHWWSPDSKSIAYLQFDVSREPIYGHIDAVPVEAVSEPERYPKAGTPNADVHVGVVSVAGGETRWLDLGEPRLYLYARVGWTPDSRNVDVRRLTRVQDKLDVLVADAAGGAVLTLYSETDKYWINLKDDFHMLPDGSVITTSERDGFRHIYHVGADGRRIEQLTRGDWEVTGIECINEAQKRIWFTSSEPSPTERQMYAINFDGGGKTRLSAGAGSHSASMSPACDLYIDSFSSLDQPPVTTLHDAAGQPLKVLRAADREAIDKYDIQRTELLTFRGGDGTLFQARLIKPAHFDPHKKYPAIVQVYGGPGAQSVRNAWSGVSLDQVFATLGYVIWQMDNRGSTGRGHAFETPIYRRLGKVEVADQVEGVRYLVSLGFVDPQRVGVMGWSYGGYMTLQCLLEAPDVFQAGAAGAPVTNWLNYDTIYTERYLGLPSDNEQGYKDSSPVNHAAQLKGKLMLLHNIEDDNVLFANSIQMQVALQNARKNYELVVYPQKSHGVGGPARAHLNEQYVRFFDQALK